MHMVDLLEFSHDFIHGNTYKYLLVLVDVASNYTAITPLRNKRASDVAFAVKDLYKHRPLKYPKELYCDGGTEFKGVFRKTLEEHGVKVKSQVTAYHHGFKGKVENRNKIISKLLFKNMDAQEMVSGKTSK